LQVQVQNHTEFSISPHYMEKSSLCLDSQAWYSIESVALGSDHVDDNWDGADDVPWCSPTHAADGNGLEYGMHACGPEPEPTTKSSTVHEQSSSKSIASGPVSSYQFPERNNPDAKQWHLRA
jgi:hypothetical protein